VNFGLKMGDESDFDCENNINEAARTYCDNLLPSVSRERYEKVFLEFEAWCNRKKMKQINEEVVLVLVYTFIKKTSLHVLRATVNGDKIN
jgi:hypothetical protein